MNYLDILSKEESNRVQGLDYDMAKTIVHERLFLIYRKMGLTNKMESEFRKGMHCLARFDEKNRLPPPTNFTYETLTEALEKSERDIDVRWKKE